MTVEVAAPLDVVQELDSCPDGYRDWSLRDWINAQPRQQEFLDAFCPVDYTKKKRFPAYGGAAGGGKSYILRKALALSLMRAHARWGVKNCRVALFCEDYPSLIDRQISKIKDEFPRHLGELKYSKNLGDVFLFNEKFGSNYIALRNLDEPGKYDSTEFADMGIDEFTKNTKLDIFDQLRKRLRWPRKVEVGGVFPEGYKHALAWASNPGGPLHGLAKRYWIDRDFPEWLKPFANEFVYIPARATDNAYNPPDYFSTLMSLPEPLRTAYAQGSWDMFQGQFFQEWREAYHVCDPFEIPTFWKRGIAFDWGWSDRHYTCILFFAVSPEGDVYVYKEFYGQERLPEWWAERILEQVEKDGISLADYTRVCDPACFNKEQRFGRPVADMLADGGVTFMRANNDRVNGWVQVRSFLAWERDPNDETLELRNLIRRPKLYVFRDAAPNLVRTIPILKSDDNRPEDVDTDTEDHPADTLRYYLMTRPAPKKIPFKALSDEWKEAILRAQRREQEREQ